MKKKLLFMVIVLIASSLLFAAEETSRLKLSATVSEGPENSGIKIISGELESGLSSSQFKELFENHHFNDLVVDAGDSIMTEDVSGFFSVLVYRQGGDNPITVNISATPMQNEDGSANYIPYKIVEKGKTSAIVNTFGSPSGGTAGVSYIANTPSGSVGVRDGRIFEYTIPKAVNATYGKYSATIFFSITLE